MSNKNLSLLLAATIFMLVWTSCKQANMPQPTDDTYVRADMEETERKSLKKRWLELLHGGPNSGWENIEYENMMDLMRYKSELASPNRDGEELLADGQVYGKWIERGATNVAGSVMNVCYDNSEDMLYAITAGGSLFKGGLSGFTWELVNDQIKFNDNLLEISIKDDGTKRLLAGISHVPHYSDDGGLNWTKCAGFPAAQSGNFIHTCYNLNNVIYILHKKSGSAKYILYRSKDGEKFELVQLMTTSDNRAIAMSLNSKQDSLYTMERFSSGYAKLRNLNPVTNKLEVIQDSCAIEFSGEKVFFQVATTTTGNKFLALDANLKMKQSVDMGKTWTTLSTLLTRPWDVGFFMSPSKPNQLLYGEVNAFRSNSGGSNWTKINDWGEYYSNVKGKLHADIMVIREFMDDKGKPVVIISHHGGISKTYDYGVTTENITLFGMNNSQYYDARSYPIENSWIFAGAQDQGMQRGNVTDELIGDFFQMISGDYGHVEFTNNGKSMWIMYPGGSLSYYKDPLSQKFPTAGYKMITDNSHAWIPPVAVNPHSDEDAVYLAGGNNGGSGSYIIKVNYVGDNDLVATQLPYNFSSSGGSVSAIAISPLNEKLWFVATSNGKFYKSNDGGNTFKLTQSMVSEGQYLYGSCILPSALDTNIVYLSGSGYGPAPVYKSVNAGKNFTVFRNGLPSTVAFNIVANEDESRLYAATEAGPYVYVAKADQWYPLAGTKTPTQTYWSVEYVPNLKAARFGTYGRGVWEFKALDNSTTTNDPDEINIDVWPNPSSDFITIASNQNKIDEVGVFAANGQRVIFTKNNPNKIDLSKLNTGIYFVKVKVDQKLFTKKIFKI